MARSFWKCLFTPLGTSRAFDSLELERDALSADLQKAQARVHELEVEIMTRREETAITRREAGMLQFDLLARDSQIADLQRRLEEATVDEKEYLEVKEAIEQFESQRQKYRDRIGMLKLQLEDARKALKLARRPEFEDTPKPIEMSQTPPEPPLARHIKPAAEENYGDWLQELPENL